jgi:hypothetical protein
MAQATRPTAMMSRNMPVDPMPSKLRHHAWKAGAILWKRTTRMRAQAKPAAKLGPLAFMAGR